MPTTTDYPTRPTPGLVPAGFRGSAWEEIEPMVRALLSRPVGSRTELEQWLVDRADVESAIDEAESILYINMTCDTENTAHRDAYLGYVETIQPKLKPLIFEIDQRQVALTREHKLDGPRYQVLSRDIAGEVELFRRENVPIQTELAKLEQKYQEAIGAMNVEFDGNEQTLPQMAKYQESTDRSVRERAWRTVADRRLRDRATLDGLYDQMIALRDQMGRNAGFKDYVGYAFKQKRRHDYTPAHCRAFHEACEKHVVPFMRRLGEQRKRSLRLDSLRPWDLLVDIKGRGPLKPFTDGVDLMRRGVRTFNLLDPRLGTMLASLGDGSNKRGVTTGESLDLDSRKGKAPGGYQAMRERSRKPFIFMNAAGVQRDVATLLHEAGHAFHSMVCRDEPLRHYRSSPLEFAEVASMTMELLTMPYWGGADGYYADVQDLGRARRKQIEDSVVTLAWVATIDAFQHWVYTRPKHTQAERTAAWLDLHDRFAHTIDWSGLEPAHEALWHRQLHLFTSPFYYIEYGIAQLGALQLWLHSLEKGEKSAVEAYLAGLRLGGSRPLPDLFKAAGLPFDFGPETVSRVVDRAERELAKLPD